jgi:dGTPase
LGIFLIGNGKKYKDQLTAKEWQDLIDFEGAMVLLF